MTGSPAVLAVSSVRVRISKLVVGASLLLIVAACGGGSGGQSPRSPLSLSSSAPATGASAAPRSVAPVLTFSAPLDVSTANSSEISLQSIAGNHVTVASVAGQNLIVTPTGVLLPLTEYTLNIGTGLRGTAGESLASPVTITFATGEGQWKTPAPIETSDEPAIKPIVSFDASGHALAVWQQTQGQFFSIWSNRYTAGSGWGAAELIEAHDGDAADPKIAVNGSGHAIAVWHQTAGTGTRASIRANHYMPGSGWGTAVLIELDDVGDAVAPQVAIDPNGNAVVVWYQFDGVRFNAWYNRYTSGVGWHEAELLELDSGHASSPRVAIDASGNALAVWQQFNGTHIDIQASRYVSGTGWGTPEILESQTGDAFDPRIAMNADGRALAVWVQSENELKAWSNRYTPGTGWGAAERIGPEGMSAQEALQVAIDARGNGIAVWQQVSGTNRQIGANRYAIGSGWTGPTVIPNDNLNPASEPQIAIDPGGSALAVWYQRSSTFYDLWWSRYTAAAWTKAATLAGDDHGDALFPQIAIDASGNAFCLAQKRDGAHLDIWSARFD
jgi:hypothetical protein